MSEGALELAAAGAALAAADGAGLLHALAEGPADAEALATRLGLDARATVCVLEVLVARGLVVSDADGYRASEALAADLKSPTASEPGAALHLFAHARRFLRDGVGYFAGSDTVPGRERKYVGAVGYLARRFSALADELAAALAPNVERVLDVGAGSAVWGLAQVARSPGARLTALDLPAVLPAAVARAEALGLADRLELLAGDVHEIDLPRAAFDRVLLANVLHLEPPARARALLARLVPALRPGGELVVVDTLGGTEPADERVRSSYGLYLSLRVTGARAHPERDVRRWLGEVGLDVRERLAFAGAPSAVGALVGSRGPDST